MASEAGMLSLDAPVSGGVGGARAATLTFMAGGSAEAFTKAKPILEGMGKKIVHCGDAGAGQSAKICNNMLLAISMIGAAEAFTLAEKLEPFHFGWLGIQLSREQSNTSGGVVIEYLFPDSSAEKAGLVKRDRLLEIDGRVVESAATLRDILLHRQSGQELPLKIAREGESREITVSLLPLPEAIPAELPLPIFLDKDANQPPVETGEVPLQLEGQARICRLFIPEEYNPRDAHGCVMWLSGSGEPIPAPQFAEWKRLCRMRGIILLMPVAENLQPWSADDTAWLIECLNETRKRYTVDTERVCLVTAGQNPGYAWQLALEHREHFKGILALSVPDRIRLPMNEPGLRFQVLLADHSERGQKIVPRLSELLRKEGFPVARVEFEQELQSTDFDAMGRWLEILGSH